jgi:pimeloyl-ACP methyl ester carboxylesterase
MAPDDEVDSARPLRRVELAGGRAVLVDDSGPATAEGPVLVWHHGSPHTGALFEPLLSMAHERGLRMIALARPGYGGLPARPGRTVADSARDAIEVADLLGIDRMLQLGASGGGPHALAVAALVPDRVTGVVVEASVAPFEDTPAWWDGMADDGALRAARRSRADRRAYADAEEFDPSVFVDTDWAALEGEWAALGDDAERAAASGPDGLVDDDTAFANPWGVDLASITAPVILIQGRRDRMVPPAHAEILACAVPHAEVRWIDDAGHIAALAGLASALDRLVARG